MLGYKLILSHRQKFTNIFLQISCHFAVVVLFINRLFGQIIPLVSVGNDSLLQRSELRTQLAKGLVDWHADSLAETNLELGQLMSEFSVKHRWQGRMELSLLQVPLVPELLCNHASNLNKRCYHFSLVGAINLLTFCW